MSTIADKIEELKKQRNAVILAHNYAPYEVQKIADIVGDSLGISQKASQTKADVVVLCGVRFMAETVAILCPEKTVLIPDDNAGCPMANMINTRQLAETKEKHKDVIVVTYVNSSAAIKAMSDICCTSSNAVAVVNSLPKDRKILFIPDRNLGHYVMTQTNRDMILWNGFCPTHERILPEFVMQLKARYPDALFVAHPECKPDTVKLADYVGSTSGIIQYCQQSSANEFIIGTENEIAKKLQNENPDKKFYPFPEIADCPNMKLVTLEKIVWCLEDMQPQMQIGLELAERARVPIRKMLELSNA